MAALSNRVHRVMHATQPAFESADVEAEAHAAIAHAFQADEATARHAARQIAGQRVLTLSRSGTVLQALMGADPPPEVFVAESRPDCEGIYVAETLARQGGSVTLITDAAIATSLAREHIDAVLVGADTVLESGAVVNKTGTRGTALAARQENVPILAVAATDKITSEETPHLEEGASTAVYDGSANLSVRNPTFDVTPANWVTRWVTEEGVLDQEAVRERAEQHRQWSRWMERAGP
jgi:translation initiation factor 2B subunit (eIF-2B alpha/beta/delta family)